MISHAKNIDGRRDSDDPVRRGVGAGRGNRAIGRALERSLHGRRTPPATTWSGLWSFDAGAELADGSGNGHDLTLNGAKVVADGRFGGCLESWRGWPDEDTAHQARAKAAPELTPKGAFTVEMWIKPKPEIEGYPDSFLLDNRYVDESGMQLILGGDSGAGRRLRMLLGIAGEHPTWTSNQYVFEPDVWYHIAFTYDGKGSGRFYINGTAQGGDDRPEYGAVATGVKNLTIGDRVGSLYHGFPGYIDQVRICKGVLEFSSAAFEAVSLRRVFVRMEKEATVRFARHQQAARSHERREGHFPARRRAAARSARARPGTGRAAHHRLGTRHQPAPGRLPAGGNHRHRRARIPSAAPRSSRSRSSLGSSPIRCRWSCGAAGWARSTG